MAGGLTQVLSDGMNTYLYGVDRINQQHNSLTEYYLADALGSVRQLTDSTGEVVLARAYDPYGSLVENNAYAGVTTAYGYTGEYTDAASGMVYLRARYYSPAQGRFVSRDVWEGDYNNPLSLNKWGYVEGNPTTYTDPSGHYPTYEREEASSYAMNWDHQPTIDPEYDITNVKGIDWSRQCTLFASSVLYHSKVRDDNPYRKDPNPPDSNNNRIYRDYVKGVTDYDPPYWDNKVMMTKEWISLGYADLNSWYNTPAFYKFTTEIIGNIVLTFNNPPQYNNNLVYGKSGSINKNWENDLIAHKGMIKKGDLVFYHQNGGWAHVAIIVGWGDPTNYGSKSNNDPPTGMTYTQYQGWIKKLQDPCSNSSDLPDRPLVVERSGRIAYALNRSLDNTENPVDTITIVHIRDN